MEFSSPRPCRKRRRLKGYDYSRPGSYFVTLCVESRRALFGEVRDGAMQPNSAGQMVARWWTELAAKFAHVEVDEHQVMPNHSHGIVILWPDDDVSSRGSQDKAPICRSSLPEIVQWFKTMTTNEYIARVRTDGWPRFNGHLWQRDYHEHVIRDNEDLNDSRRYIRDNAANWQRDEENPIVMKIDPRWGGGVRSHRPVFPQ